MKTRVKLYRFYTNEFKIKNKYVFLGTNEVLIGKLKNPMQEDLDLITEGVEIQKEILKENKIVVICFYYILDNGVKKYLCHKLQGDKVTFYLSEDINLAGLYNKSFAEDIFYNCDYFGIDEDPAPLDKYKTQIELQSNFTYQKTLRKENDKYLVVKNIKEYLFNDTSNLIVEDQSNLIIGGEYAIIYRKDYQDTTNFGVIRKDKLMVISDVNRKLQAAEKLVVYSKSVCDILGILYDDISFVSENDAPNYLVKKD